MMRILITLICILFSATGFSQDQTSDCKTAFDNINNKKANILPKVSEIDSYITIIETNKNKASIDITIWENIKDNWESFKESYDKYSKIEHEVRNQSDEEKILDKWKSFKNLLKNKSRLFSVEDFTVIKTIKKVDTNTNGVKELIVPIPDNVIRQINTYTDKKVIEIIDNANKHNKSILEDTRMIKDHLYKLDSTIKSSTNISGFSNNIYGIGYLQIFQPKNTKTLNAFAGMLELLMPFDSFKVDNMGIFVSAGIQNRSMVFFAGLGYFDNQSSENISWKGTCLYFPESARFGIGASYSPLTKAGIVVSIKLNN